MKNLLLLLLCFITTSTIAQPYFLDISFKDALKKAKKKGKLLMVRLESAECNQCNAVAFTGLNGAGVEEVAEKYVVSVSFTPNVADWKVLSRTHFVSFGILFFNEDGELLHRYTSSTTLGETYINEIKKAIGKQTAFQEHTEMSERFTKGERSTNFLKEFIIKKQMLGLHHDATVTIYLDLLLPNELNKEETIDFLITTAPILSSNADMVMRKDSTLFNNCWAKLPYSERVKINQSIISKTRNLAISTKSISLANRVAQFTYNTYLPDREAGLKASYKQRIYYYSGIKDTFSIYSYGKMYCTQYLLNVSSDSLNRKDSLERISLINKTETTTSLQTPAGVTSKSFKMTKSANIYANELDEIAKMFLQLKDTTKLSFALYLSERAMDLYEVPAYLETRASLLLKLNRNEEALSVLEQALDLTKKKGWSIEIISQRIIDLKNNTPQKN